MKDWNVKRIAIDITLGAIGVGLALGVFHAYIDHQNLHALINLVNDNARAKQNAGPAPQPTAPAK